MTPAERIMRRIDRQIAGARSPRSSAFETMLVKIDFVNGDVRDFMRHIMKAVVK